MLRYGFIWLLLCACVYASSAQAYKRFNAFAYNVNEGLLQSNILDAAFDGHNFLWLSFANGIQKFDGEKFTQVPVQKGLPDDKWVKLFRCANGELLVSHSGGISRYNRTSNRFETLLAAPQPQAKAAYFIGEDEGRIYLMDAAGKLTALDAATFKIVSETATPFGYDAAVGGLRISDNIVEHCAAFFKDQTVYLWRLSDKKIVAQTPPLDGISAYFLHLLPDRSFLCYRHEGPLNILRYRFGTNEATGLHSLKKEGVSTFRGTVFKTGGTTIFSAYRRLYETDDSIATLAYELVNFANEPLGGKGSVVKIVPDNFGNLYLITVNDGFKKIIWNHYPLRYYAVPQKEGSYVVSLLAHKERNRILAGTVGNGVLVFDTGQRLVKHIRTLPGENKGFSCTAIVRCGDGYLLFPWDGQWAWKLDADLSNLQPVVINTPSGEAAKGMGYFAAPLLQDAEKAVIISERHVYKINSGSNAVAEYALLGISSSGLWQKGFVLTHFNNQLVWLNAATMQEVRRLRFENTGGVRCFVQDAEGHIYLGSNKGIFKIDNDGRLLQQWNKETGLPDECIYAMAFDNEGLLWCSSNKGIFRIDKENQILQLTKDDGLQENEFNTNVVSRAADGELFFGGINGVSSFYPSQIKSFAEKLNLLVTKITVNNAPAFEDTAVWNVGDIELPFDKASLSFDFVAMAGSNPSQYVYQYRMKGLDEGWLQDAGLHNVRYSLPPGEYTFQLYASRVFDKDAKPMKEIRITIRPPWWKTVWFGVVVSVLLLLLVAYFINDAARKRYRKKLSQLESEHKLQLERERISRDLHDSIGAYANAVLYNTELLEAHEAPAQQDALMKDLKEASKDIIAALRATIWALNKESYTAEECLMRIRNFVQPFNRYYPQISFKVEGEAPLKTLPSTDALNLVRIVQEALANAIKHAGATRIIIQSSETPKGWRLQISDDGKGFAEGDAKTIEGGNGVANMKKRAAESRFELEMHSSAERGTVITVVVPS